MTEPEITALASEYGEYVANSLDYDMCSDPELRHILAVKGHSESAQPVLEWLLRRYCLVEKSIIKETWSRITDVYLSHDHITYEGARYLFDEVLFPEIAKEVEG